MIKNDIFMYGLNDLSIIPASVTSTIHRNDASVVNSDDMLPIFTAPMPSVVDDTNYGEFIKNKINVVIPRTVSFDKRMSLMYDVFVAVSLEEFNYLFIDERSSVENNDRQMYICIDIANGHMGYMHSMMMEAKLKYRKNLVLMAGSVANPAIYKSFAEIGVDYIRVGIGGGSICTTSVLSGVHVTLPYILSKMVPQKEEMEQLVKRYRNDQSAHAEDIIEEIEAMVLQLKKEDKKDKNKKHELMTVPKIIVDGGIDSFAKINKLLALGADYVMLGGMLAKCKESAAKTINIDGEDYHEYYGMSTVKAQLEYGIKKENLRLPEGIEKRVKVEYTLKEFTNMFSFYLREAMSLTDCKNLNDFGPKKVTIGIISNNAFSEFNDGKK